jgi:hypothetical protein
LIVLRDDLEQTLRAWNAYELGRNAPAVIDFDCYPDFERQVLEPCDRLSTFWALRAIRQAAAQGRNEVLIERVDAHLAYLRALMGERPPLDQYVVSTQGCHARGWPEDYIQAVGETARKHLDGLGVRWGPGTREELGEVEQKVDPNDAPDAIAESARGLEPAVRQITGTKAPYNLTVETTSVNAYWAYWTDGRGPDVRVRLNMKHAQFTKVQVRQFALHEVLGHGLQGASYAQRCLSGEDVPWVRLMSVHAQQQVLFEGLAQALPLFTTPDDEQLVARVRLDHFTQLVRSTIHVALGAGSSVESCMQYAQEHIPYWSLEDIADLLSDRGTDPLLRSYLWAYPAGIDWFTNLADAKAPSGDAVLNAAYRDPLTPGDLADLWPKGPVVGGPGRSAAVLGST